MATLLHIDSSPRGDQSLSRRFTRRFVNLWKASHPGDRVIYRDLGRHPVPHINEDWIAAAITPPDVRGTEQQQRLSLSDMLIDELIASERYVFGIPMYNLGIPSTFKAYIDHIVRVHRTLHSAQTQGSGLMTDKKMLVVTTRGDRDTVDPPDYVFDFQEPFVRAIFGRIGITDINFIKLDNLACDRDARAQSLSAAKQRIKHLVMDWSQD
jgi:FMN-dependent NADH-azoreductase